MSDKYFIPSGHLETQRLAILHQVFFDATYRYLSLAGIQTAQKVLEVGCGTGEMLSFLEKEGLSGLCGIDIDRNQLEVARARTKNINFLEHDITQPIPLEPVDLVYSRFLLHHLKNPEGALDHLIKMVKKDGYLVLGEPIMYGQWIYPNAEAYHRIYEMHLENTKAHPWDPNYGEKLLSVLSQRTSLEIIKKEHFRPILEHAELKQYHLLVFDMFSEQFIQKGLLKSEEKSLFREEIEQFVNEPYVTDLFGVVLVCARKL